MEAAAQRTPGGGDRSPGAWLLPSPSGTPDAPELGSECLRRTAHTDRQDPASRPQGAVEEAWGPLCPRPAVTTLTHRAA